MSRLVETRERGQKHLLCKDADTELVFISERIKVIRYILCSSGFRMLGFGPINQDGGTVPLIPTARLIQERMDAFAETLLQLKCYMAIQRDVDGIPAAGENGRKWLKDLCKEFRITQRAFEALVADVLDLLVTLLVGVGLDTAQHASFYAKYQWTLAAAMEQVHLARVPADIKHATTLVKRRAKEYSHLDPMARFIPFAATLSETGLVQVVALLFQVNLKRWDRMHGIRAPRARRVLEVLAYDLEPQYRRGNYDLRALFQRLDS